MKKTRKFISIFAILFALLFAFSVCFFAACGNKDEEEEEPETPPTTVEHVHDYQPADWTFSDDYSSCTATLTCVSTTGECDAPTNGTVSATVTSEPTDATCIAYAGTVYTATYEGKVVRTATVETGDTYADHVYTNESKVTFAWEGDEETGYTNATATIACAVCGKKEQEMTVDFVAPDDETIYGTYTATATYGEGDDVVTKTDTKTITAPGSKPVVEEGNLVHVDFSDPETYSWVDTTFATASTDETGVLKIPANDKMSLPNEEVAGALCMGGNTDSSLKKHIEMNLSSYVGTTVTINVVMSSNSNEARSLYVDTQNTSKPSTTSSTILAHATSNAQNDYQLLTHTETLTSEHSTLYLTCDASVNIFSIDISTDGDVIIPEPGEVAPTVSSVTLSQTSVTSLSAGETADLTATVTMSDGSDYEGTIAWTSSNTTVATVAVDESDNTKATVTAVGFGTTYLTVTAGEKSATCTVSVPVDSGKTCSATEKLDFSDSSTFSWLQYNDTEDKLAQSTTMTSGIWTLQTRDQDMSVNSSGYLNTAGQSKASGSYIKIDLSGYVGSYVTFEVVMDSSTVGRSCQITGATPVDSSSTNESGAYVSVAADGDGAKTLTYAMDVTTENSTVYVVWSASISIYSVTLDIYDWTSANTTSL